MKSFLKVTAAAALLALAMAPGRALASGSGTATLPVQASVTSGCLIGTVGLNFGAVSPLIVEEDLTTVYSGLVPTGGTVTAGVAIDAAYTASGDIEIACGTNGPTTGSSISVQLDNGANAAIAPILGIGTDAYATRAMTNSTSFLAYDLLAPNCVNGTVVGGALGTICSVTGGVNYENVTSLSVSPNQYENAVAFASNGSLAFNGVGAPAAVIPIVGLIPGDQVQPLTPGVYTDTVNVSVTF